MVTTNVHDAKTHLSRYLTLAGGGEDVVIMRRGKPVARLVGIKPKLEKRQAGRLEGEFRVTDDFFAADGEIESLFNK